MYERPPGTVAPVHLARTARQLLHRGGSLQSTDTGQRIGGDEILDGLTKHIQQAQVRAAGGGDQLVSNSVSTLAANEVLRTANRAMSKLDAGTGAGSLSDIELDALQAIVEVIGRPALRYVDGRVQLPPTLTGENEFWHVFIATARSKINRVSASVARVAIEQPGGGVEQLGTAWRLGPDLLVTNRHVVAPLVVEASRPPGEWTLNTARTVIADFAVTESATQPGRFLVAELMYCADESSIDFAVLRLQAANGVPASLPVDVSLEALGVSTPSISGSAPETGRSAIYVVGHPYREFASSASVEVFGVADGSKRCSPGYITAFDAGQPLFEHDCSTLGGNSGSCVFSKELHRVVGLHIGGQDVQSTGVGRANVAIAFARLEGHRAGKIVRDAHV